MDMMAENLSAYNKECPKTPTFGEMKEIMILTSQVPHFKKEGKMERRANGSCGRNGSQSSQGNWFIWISKFEKRVTSMKNHKSE